VIFEVYKTKTWHKPRFLLTQLRAIKGVRST